MLQGQQYVLVFLPLFGYQEALDQGCISQSVNLYCKIQLLERNWDNMEWDLKNAIKTSGQ